MEAPREKELDTGILFRDGWSSFCVYSDDAQMLLSVEGQVNEKDLFKFNGGFETRAYVLYDLNQEKIKYVYLLQDEFSVENGTLTNTLKVKYRKVCELYKNEIDALYKTK